MFTHRILSLRGPTQLATTRAFSQSSSAHFLGQFNKQLAATKPKEHVVEMLTKPIGLETPPQETDNMGDTRTVSQKFRDFMDRDQNKVRQRQLEREFAKSGMYDLYTFRKTKGKLFLSPPAYWKAEKAQYFPNMYGEDLLSSKHRPTMHTLKGKVSVVRVYTSQMGDKSSKGYFHTSEGDYLTSEGYTRFQELYPHSQIVDINITENGLKAAFVQMSKSGLRKASHVERHDKYFIVPRKTVPLEIREQVHMDNTYGGFVYVLDHEMKIRWAVCGDVEEKDRNLLWRTVRGLEREYKALFP